jgi:CRP-like cAMP-binding protein
MFAKAITDTAMTYDLILQNVSRHITLTPQETTFFTSLLHPKKIRKRQYYLQEGDVCKNLAFVTKGCLRSYNVDQSGHEYIIQFAIEEWWISDMNSFRMQQPSTTNIDALEPTEVLLLSKDDLERLLTEVPKFERFFRILAENAIVAHQNRIHENIALYASDRYTNFVSRYPKMAQRLPQTQIAAYLGITPEFLSKIRNELAKKQ